MVFSIKKFMQAIRSHQNLFLRKKKLILLLIILLILAVLGIIWLAKNSEDEFQDRSDFAIQDTALVTRIVISDKAQRECPLCFKRIF